MPAVNPPSPATASGPDPAQTMQLIEMELARARALRLSRGHGAQGSRLVLHAACALFLLALVAGGCYAFWCAQEMRARARPPAAAVRPAPAP